MSQSLNHASHRQQSGTVLIVALLILMVLTIIGVSSMSTSSLEERMAGNYRDRQIAFQAAETALAFAESYVAQNVNSAGAFNNANGFYQEFSGPTWMNAHNSTWWSGTNSIVLATNISEVNSQPRYTIEYRGEVGTEDSSSINIGSYGTSAGGGLVSSFRITARGTGLSDNTVVILQSFYGKRL